MAAQDQSSGQQMLRDDWRGNELNLWEGHMFPKKSSSGTNHTLKICPLNKHPSKQQSNHIPNCISPHQKMPFAWTSFSLTNQYTVLFIFLVKNLKHTRTNIGYATGKTILHPKKQTNSPWKGLLTGKNIEGHICKRHTAYQWKERELFQRKTWPLKITGWEKTQASGRTRCQNHVRLRL